MSNPTSRRPTTVSAPDALGSGAGVRYSLAGERVTLGKLARVELSDVVDASQHAATTPNLSDDTAIASFDLNAALFNLAAAPDQPMAADPFASSAAQASPTDLQAPAAAASSASKDGLPGLLLSTGATLAGIGALGVLGLAKVDSLQHSVAEQRHQLDDRIDALVVQAKDQANAKLEGITAQIDAKVEGITTQIDAKVEGLNTQVDTKIADATVKADSRIEDLTTQAGKELEALKAQLSDTAAIRDDVNARIDAISHQLDRIAAALDPTHVGLHPVTAPSGVLTV